jgi:hypothetical protein
MREQSLGWCYLPRGHGGLYAIRFLQPLERPGEYWEYQHRDLGTTQDAPKG